MERAHGIAGWRMETPPAEVPSEAGDFACVVAIPARDEAGLIERCLNALSAQQAAPPFAVALFLNNCCDETADVVRRAAGQLSFPLYVYEADLAQQLADAAWARRLVVNAATALVRKEGIVLSTDADSYVASHWISDCIAAIDNGADIVCGFVAPDFSDAPALDFETLRHGALEYEYSQLATELVLLIDPDPYDPWPRHQMETGANLAVRASVLRTLGGVPHICPGEDQALVRAARWHGFHVRHDFKPHVTTSSRLQGRASGGWSEDLKMRADNQRGVCHEKLEPASHILRRALLRARMRQAFGGPDFARRVRRFAEGEAVDTIMAARTFDEAWARIEAVSPMLAPRPLYRTALEDNLARLRAAVEQRRNGVSPQSAPGALDVAASGE